VDIQSEFDSSKEQWPFLSLANPQEAVPMLEFVQKYQPRTLIEIGTGNGGMTHMFMKAAARDAFMVTVDKTPNASRQPWLSEHCDENQRVLFVVGFSETPPTIKRVQEEHGGKQVDLLFIDGDHNGDTPRMDYQNYSPFVKEGGLIVFHDISHSFSVKGVWEEIPDSWEKHLFESDHGYGYAVAIKGKPEGDSDEL
jgi:cephalosporin hydroxylase